MAISLQLYPSGFLGAVLEDQPKPVKMNTDSAGMVYDSNYLTDLVPKEDISVNEALKQAYENYIKKSSNVNTFDFHDEVIRNVLVSFGVKNFGLWLRLQAKSPFLTDLHYKFLLDILNFTEKGQRSMNLVTWLSLIDSSTKCSENKKFIELSTEYENYRIADLIIRWCSWPNGINDMIQSMYILFGNK